MTITELQKKGNIGALIIRIGFGVNYTVIILRSPKTVLVIIQAPNLVQNKTGPLYLAVSSLQMPNPLANRRALELNL